MRPLAWKDWAIRSRAHKLRTALSNMDWILLSGAGWLVFLARDVLAMARRRTYAGLALHSGAVLILGICAERISRDQVQALLNDTRFWAPSVGIQAGMWAAMFWTRRRGWGDRLWGLMAIPSPMYLVSAGGLTWWLLTKLPGSKGAVAGAAVGALYGLIVLGTGPLIARMSVPTVERVWDFAAAANLSALLLLPLHQQASATGSSEPGLDWKAVAIPIVMTVGLVGISYAVNRQRSATRAWRPL